MHSKPFRQSAEVPQASSQKPSPEPSRPPQMVSRPQLVAGIDGSHVIEVQYPPGALTPSVAASPCVMHCATPAIGAQSAVD